jgi:hypothetical protein
MRALVGGLNMPVVAKISSSNAGLNSAPAQTVQGSLAAPAGSSVALHLTPEAIAGFTREGSDLVVHLKTGEVLRIANFYADPAKASQLLLVSEDGMLAADVSQLAPGAMSTATYVPIDAVAGFSTPAAGAEAAAAGAAAEGGGFGAGAVIPLALLGVGGAVAALASGGDDDDEPAPAPNPPDTTAPAAATNLAINAEGTTLTGNAEAGATVRIDVDGNGSVDYTTTAGSNGTFSITLAPPLVDGETVSVTVRDAAGNTSPAATTTAPDSTAPAAPASVTISDDGTTISGIAEAGHTVQIDIDQDGDIDHTAVVGADGTFTIELPDPLDNGEDIHVIVVDPAGNPSEPVPVSAPDLTPPPATAPTIAASDGMVLSGTASEGVAVVLTDAAGNTIGQATVAADGTWSFTPTTPLPDGTVVNVAAVNESGEAGPTASVTVDAVAPAIPTVEPSNGEVVSGTAEAGATLLLTDGSGDPLGQVTADADGNWSFTPGEPFADGQSVVVVAMDAAGNTSPATGIIVDAQVPAAPTIVPPNGESISGTAEPGSTVILTNGDGELIAQIGVGGTGDWAFAPAEPFEDGTVIEVVSRDDAGNTSAPVTATVDALPPAAPVIEATQGAALSGTAEAGSTVTLTDGEGNVIGETTADEDGAWSLTPDVPLPDGTEVSATATDTAGNTSATATITVDATPPAAPVIAASNGTQVSGTAEPLSTITLTDGDGNEIGETTTDEDGAWSFTPDAPLPDGTVVNATATDAAGNTGLAASATVDAIAPTAPTVEASDGSTLSGTAEIGATVILTDGDGNALGEAEVDEDGNWTFTPATPLPDGTVVNATVQDAAGNSSDAVSTIVDAIDPVSPVINPTDGTTLSGTAEAFATVTLTDADGNTIAVIDVDETGEWAFTPDVPLPDGTVISAVAIDAAGNTSLPGTTTVDAVAPAVPTIAPTNGEQLTGTAEPLSTITLTDGDGNEIGETTTDEDGVWSFTPDAPLPDGTVVNATATDAAGNSEGAASTSVDAVAPEAPTVEASDGSVLAGTAEPGSTVIVTNGDGDPIGETTADEDGEWTITPGTPLPEGTVINVIAQDPAGNESGSSTTTIDATPPAAPTIEPSNGVLVTGTAEPGSIVLLFDATGLDDPTLGVPIGEALADDNGEWTFEPLLQLPDGTVVGAVAVDAAGNSGAPATTTVDGVAPPDPTIEPSDGSVLTGTAEAGVTVLLTGSLGEPIGEAVADEDGVWLFTPGAPLPDGTSVNAVAVDAAGNESLSVTTVTDSVDPSPPVIAASNGAIINGTAEPFTTVLLTTSLGEPIGEAPVGPGGTWTFAPESALPNGTVVSVVAQDAVGNLSEPAEITVDAVPPPLPTLEISSDGTLLTGTAEPGSQLLIVVDGDGTDPILIDIDQSGTFSLPLAPPLVAGETLQAISVDAAGNASGFANTVAPDLVPPVIAVPEAADTFINGTELADGIQVAVEIRPTMQVGQTVTVEFAGQNGYETTTSYVLTSADIAAGTVTVTVLPGDGLGPFPQGASTITASVGAGATAAPVPFTIDTVPPAAPVLSLIGNILTISAEPGTALDIDVTVGGITANVQATADNDGLASVDLLADLDIGLDWNELLTAEVSVTGTDLAGNTSNIATLDVLPSLEQPVTIGGLALDVNLLPPVLGVSGATEPNSTVFVQLITPALDVNLLPIETGPSGTFEVNLLSAQVLDLLQISPTGLLNLGSELSLNLVAVDSDGNQSAAYGVSLTGAGLGLNIGEIAITGTGEADVLSSVVDSAELINAGDGSDLVLDVALGDRVLAGSGDDTVELTATNFVSVGGGAGFDTILLAEGIDLDYNAPGVGTFTNIERVDLGTGDTGSSLTLTAAEVDAITDGNNTLQITGEANDTLSVTGAVETGSTQLIDGVTYDVYTFGANTLLIEENSVQVVV